MYTKEIKQLIEMLEDSDLHSIEYKDKNFEISLSKKSVTQVVSEKSVESVPESVPVVDEGVTIDAPLVGVFYSKPAPGQSPYVNVGQTINVGDTLCIIEAMKVMNEIKADKSGVIKEILVSDQEAVSFNQPLFKIV